MLELLSEFCLTPVGFQGASVREAQPDTNLPDVSDVERGTLLKNEKRSKNGAFPVLEFALRC
jgi:hypothetical protein